MSLSFALILLLAGLCLGAFAVTGSTTDRIGPLIAATGLLSSVLLAAALIVATEATADRARILGLFAVLIGAAALVGGVIALAQRLADPGEE